LGCWARFLSRILSICIAVADRYKTAQLWDVATGKPLGPPLRHNDRLANDAVAFSPDGKTVLTSSGDKTARLWRLDETRLPDDPGILERWIAVRTKLQITPNGLIQPLSSQDWETARRILGDKTQRRSLFGQ
jgi:WD40 repeat protein